MKTGKSVLVTGGAGYIGSVLTRNLVIKGYDVKVLDSLVFGDSGIKDLVDDNLIELFLGDIRDANSIKNALSSIDYVIHLAAIVGEPLCKKIPTSAMQINEMATKKLVEMSKENGSSRFVFASTCSNYGSTSSLADESTPVQSLSLYSKTKVKSESYVLQSNDKSFSSCVLRFATAFGLSPRMRFDLLLQEFIRGAVINNKISVYGSEYWRPLVHVQDISNSCLLALEKPIDLIKGQIYNVGDNEQNYKKIDLARMIKEYLPNIDIEIVKSKQDPRNYKVSFDKIHVKLGFKIKRTVRDGIEEILDEIQKGKMNPSDSDFSNLSKSVESIQKISQYNQNL